MLDPAPSPATSEAPIRPITPPPGQPVAQHIVPDATLAQPSELPQPSADDQVEQPTDAWSTHRTPASLTSANSHTLASLSFIFDDISTNSPKGKSSTREQAYLDFVDNIDNIADCLSLVQIGDPVDLHQQNLNHIVHNVWGIVVVCIDLPFSNYPTH